ncbi:MAG: pyridoxal-dependent decarboxylase [Bacteriovorax sp.]|nr:pyridoxal-dependent decarboxylase [Bacteriovorax sp.]
MIQIILKLYIAKYNFTIMNDTKSILSDLYFLGPKGEQRKFLSEAIELITNDYIFWRRNFYPKDPPAILHRSLTSDTAKDYNDVFMQSLIKLLGELKQDLPFFSPRYIAHMTPDISLPSIIGYYAGLLYHSNNVSVEASPVTLKYEIEVGKEFARLFGFDDQNSFGHITSGGTVANYESIFFNKAIRFIPLTLGLILKIKNYSWPEFLPKTVWELLNISIDKTPEILQKFNQIETEDGLSLESLINQYSIAALGDWNYWKLIEEKFDQEVSAPVIIAPATSHYSWSKASNLFGIGRQNILQVKVDKNLVMDVTHLNEVLNYCHKNKIPIIQIVCVLGTTEFGSFDPIHEIIPILESWRAKKLYCPLHLDAAYGGYFKTMFTSTVSENDEYLGEVFKYTSQADSITIDPHKLGHTPYGAGVFLTKHGFAKEFVSETAEYCLASQSADEPVQIGKYILEGSKSGAIATSVYFTNKLITLDYQGYGKLLKSFNDITMSFYQKILNFNLIDTENKQFEIVPIIKPQSNLICFYLKPKRTHTLSEINEFNAKIIQHFFHGHNDRIHDYKYFVSKTKLNISKLTSDAKEEIFKKIKIDDKELLLFRIVFLNLWFNTYNENNQEYSDDFLNEIELQSNTSLNSEK